MNQDNRIFEKRILLLESVIKVFSGEFNPSIKILPAKGEIKIFNKDNRLVLTFYRRHVPFKDVYVILYLSELFFHFL